MNMDEQPSSASAPGTPRWVKVFGIVVVLVVLLVVVLLLTGGGGGHGPGRHSGGLEEPRPPGIERAAQWP